MNSWEKFTEEFMDFDTSWGHHFGVCVRIGMIVFSVAAPIVWCIKHL